MKPFEVCVCAWGGGGGNGQESGAIELGTICGAYNFIFKYGNKLRSYK